MESGYTESKEIPKDRGWAWVVLIAAWLNNILVSGIYKTFGILFIEIQTKFNSTSAKTSLIYSLLNASFSITSLLIAILDLKSFSSRLFICVGTLLASLGYLLAALVPNVDLLILSLGTGLGIGQGFIFAPQLALIGRYFDKKKGLANCIAMTGGSVGSLILPYLIGWFVDMYNLSGTLMLLAALNLNGVVYAALMRPFPMQKNLEMHKARKSFKTNECQGTLKSENEDVALLNDVKSQITISMLDGDKKDEDEQAIQIQDISNPLKLDEAVLRPNSVPANLKLHHLQKNNSSVSKVSLFGSSDLNMTSIDNFKHRNETDSIDSIDKRASLSLCALVKSRLNSLLDLNVFKTPIFLYFLPCAVLIANGSSMYLSFLLPHAKDVGLTQSEINSLMVLIGIADIVTIPMWGLLADRQFLKSNRLVVIAMCFIGTSLCFASYYSSYGTVIMFSAVYGIFGRVYFSLSPVILNEFLGVENLQSSVGISMVCQAIFHSIMLPLVGLMRDNFGTYIHSYQMMGAYVLVGATGLMTLPDLVVKLHGPLKTGERGITLTSQIR